MPLYGWNGARWLEGSRPGLGGAVPGADDLYKRRDREIRISLNDSFSGGSWSRLARWSSEVRVSSSPP